MFVSSLSWECRDIVTLFLSGVNVRFLCVVGFAGGGTPGHLILGGGVFKKNCVEIWYALGDPLVTAYAAVTGGVALHVRTCTPRFCI